MTDTVAEWLDEYATYLARMHDLQSAGAWIEGPSDLMSVMRVLHVEAHHSDTIAWLLQPDARHGLRARLLQSILEAGWPDEEIPDLRSVVVRREVPMDRTIADIVVRCESLVLVIENKVSSTENLDRLIEDYQCQNLFTEWTFHEPASDIRFLLLSIGGEPPVTTRTQAAANAWRSMSYASLHVALERALEEGTTDAAGRAAVEQYLVALSSMTRPEDELRVSIGGGRIDHDD